MAPLPFVLVLVSACTHGIWNFLAKRAHNKDIFIGLSKLSEAAIFLIPFLWLLAENGYGTNQWPLFVLVAAGFVFLNYYFLSQAYKKVDLSVAYPLSRSSSLFLPILAFVFIDERIDLVGIVAILLITLAVPMLQLEQFSRAEIAKLGEKLREPGILFALLAALMAASYTLWDKVAVSQIPPFIYFYSYTFLTALFYFGLLQWRFERAAIVAEWRAHKWSIIAVAGLNTFTYLLVLYALSVSKASYVGALRQLSLVVGVFLGWYFLRERLNRARLVAIGTLIAGSGLIALAN